MVAITSPGVGSGLDVNSLVTQLMNAERQPLVAMQKKESTIQSKISAFGQLKSTLSSLKDAALTLKSASTAAINKATISDSKIATVTAATGAVKGSYDLQVIDLAQAHKLVSATPAFADKTAVVGSGTMTIQLGSYDSGTNTFTNNPDKAAVAITIDPLKNTLGDIRDAINSANAGVTASIINDGTGSRLAITSNETGAKNSIKITTTDDDTSNQNNTGLSRLAYDPVQSSGNGKNMTQSVQAMDAHITLDSIDITSASNTITGAVENVTFNLTAKTTSAVKVTVDRDAEAVKKAVTTLVDSFNNYQKTSKSLTNYDATSKTGAALNGETTVNSALSNTKRIFTSSLGSTNDYNMLTDIGITFQQDGTLKIDSTKLDSAIATKPDAVTKLFAETGTVGQTGYIKGFAAQIYDLSTSMLASDGQFENRITGLNTSITSLKKQEDAFQNRLDSIEKRYRAQFQSLDTMMSSWNSVSSYLNQQYNKSN